jgi:16S rRNA (cytosine967-C5)-methyltransferase
MGSSKRLSIPDWRQLEGTPERKIKDALMNYQRVRALKVYSDWMDEVG